jgi:GntR family transcriptional regulator
MYSGSKIVSNTPKPGEPMTRSKIDRKAYEPAYLQLINIIRDQISRGIYRSGDRLPSESKLCRLYQVSPMTVRRAINVLIEQGVVSTAQGRGTFVSPLQLSKVSFGLDEFHALFTEAAATQIKILEASIVKADQTVAAKLHIPLHSRTIHIRRLLSKEGEPWIYHREYLIYDPRRPVVEAEMKIASLAGLFSGGSDSDLKWGKLSVSAAVLQEADAALLQVEPAGPAFHLEHIFLDYANQPVSWGVFLCRGDKFLFSATVGLFGDSATDAI